MKNLFIILSLLITFASCSHQKNETLSPAAYVDPFIGTGGHGHTYPGPSAPFGMVQLSPDTKINDWDHCSGYHFNDTVILGFSHTHLSGTGVGDYGDIRMMPATGSLKMNPGDADHPDAGYASRFKKSTEKAKAAYYSVKLSDYNILVELTATPHAGFQRYTFPASDNSHVIIDLKEAVTTEKVLHSSLRFISNHEIEGLRQSDGWANDQYVYFYADFSKPFADFGIWENGVLHKGLKQAEGTALKAYVNFRTKKGEQILVKTGLSAVDTDGARNNLEAEIPGWNFDSVRQQTFQQWNNELSRIQVKGNQEKQKTIFYTALYHSFLSPNIYSDIDGRFRGHDHQVHRDSTFKMYTVFSLWDTFRALHPLFTITQRRLTNNLIRSMLNMYSFDSLLPVWELAGNETNCMIGYHSVSVITDAYKKGIRGFNARQALKAMVHTANANHFGLKAYKTKGYIPADEEGESVSKTLEYAYDDWCIAQMADMLHDSANYKIFTQRGQYYKNIFDRKSGFFRGRENGGFVKPFDPTQVNFMLTEANTWQYNFFVPQDINTLIQLLGGDKGFSKKLDELFSSKAGLSGRSQSDITGMIGQYAHGNEPSHHMAYLYNYCGQAWKTQQLIHHIMQDLYSSKPDGLAGNEDCGQMSAWYVLSAMGFYQVTPGSDKYIIGSPVFDTANIHLENGKTFSIITHRKHQGDFYIQSVTYNGKPWPKSYLTQEMILNGGILQFEMGANPNKNWGKKPADRPHQQITDFIIVPVPYFKAASKTFTHQISVGIQDIDTNATIYYSINSGPFKKYSDKIILHNNTRISAYAIKDGRKSKTENAEFIKIPANRRITLESKCDPQYTGGVNALINTIRGGHNFKTGNWQGFYNEDLRATIDLGKTEIISHAYAGFLQDQNSWIFMPKWVSFEGSTDGSHFHLLGKQMNNIDKHAEGGIIKDFEVTFNSQPIRYLRVIAKYPGNCPAWHRGAGNPSYIFADEIWVKP